jgi:hypothetical protein
MADRDEKAPRGKAPPTEGQWTFRTATDDDIRRYFGSGNLLIGSVLKPTFADPTTEGSSATERKPRQNKSRALGEQHNHLCASASRVRARARVGSGRPRRRARRYQAHRHDDHEGVGSLLTLRSYQASGTKWMVQASRWRSCFQSSAQGASGFAQTNTDPPCSSLSTLAPLSIVADRRQSLKSTDGSP